jgi:serine/threonine-protein kinase
MGAVYLARRLHIGDDVAVKLLHSDLVVEAQAVERFRREARSAAMINHPNVVSIHDFSDGRASGSAAYIVMELVKGSSLRDLLKRAGRFSPAHAVALMNDICAGVGIAHRQGLLHRDLKPDNVIVKPALHEGDREIAKVVDFGLAKLRDVNSGSMLTQTGTVIGTLSYMSPEQCSSQELDPRADVYSLGAMLYEMLTGDPPFKAESFVGLIAKHLHETPPAFPPALRIPTAVEQVCLRSLAKNRDQRPPDALALIKELQAALAAPPPAQPTSPRTAELRPVVPPPEMARASGSRWWKWLLGFAAMVVVLGVTGAVIAVKYGAIQIPQLPVNNVNTTPNRNTPNQNQKVENDAGKGATPSPQKEASPRPPVSLKGTWVGTYGPYGQPARLIINAQQGAQFDGVLEQGTVTVRFSGSLHDSTIKMKQTAVLKGGESAWVLGEDVGTLAENAKRMSGTGKDPIAGVMGMSYEWSFTRQ